MIISTIVAVGHDNAIGVNNDLPWHLPADLKFFKETTKGHFVIMGRKSFESIGRPLPGRTNIIVTRQKDYSHAGIHVFNTISDALLFAKNHDQKEAFILGGSNIYHQTQNIWDKLYITNIDVAVPNATAFFPDIDFSKWKCDWREAHQADEKNAYDYTFNLYTRV